MNTKEFLAENPQCNIVNPFKVRVGDNPWMDSTVVSLEKGKKRYEEFEDVTIGFLYVSGSFDEVAKLKDGKWVDLLPVPQRYK